MKSLALTAATGLAVSIAVAALAPATAAAQEINLVSLDQQPHRVHLTTGVEYGFVAGAGYGQVVRFLDRHVVLTGELTAPWADLDLSDLRVRGSALVPLVGSSHWKLAASAAPVVRSTDNRVSRMIDVGLDLRLVGGFYSRAWFVALEGGADLALTTHVTHSDEYRDNVHADARDGWYTSPGGNLYGGLQAGVTVSRYDLIARLGQVRDIAGQPPLMPLYGTVSVAARW